MYQQYFGLSEAPFSIAPDPRYLYLSDKHREALAHLIYGVGDQGGFIVLTGEVGTGKTTICRCLLQQIPDNADIAFIINPKQSINQLLQSIFNDLNIDYEKGITSKDLIDKLNQYLLEAHAAGRNTILIIDEAQNLSVDVLEQLRLLTNLETNEKKLLQLVLLGQPELNGLLEKSELRQLAQRVTARFHLSPLSKNEVMDYIEHRLSVAGCRSELFSKSAITKIYRLTKGVPRLINLLCDRALLGVYATNSSQASPKVIANAAKEVFPQRSGNTLKPVWLAAGFAIVILLVGLMWKKNQPIFIQSDVVEVAEPVVSNSEKAHKSAIIDASLVSEIPTSDLKLSVSYLHNLWGLESVSSSVSCNTIALPDDLYCLSEVITFKQLEQYNVPAALILKSPIGKVMSVTIQSIGGGVARFYSDDGEFTVPVSGLEQYDIQQSYLLTRIHPELSLPIQPGEDNEMINWFARYLTINQLDNGALEFTPIATALVDENLSSQKANKYELLYAHYLQFKSRNSYDDTLVAAVKRQQQQLGVETSAIINFELMSQLNNKAYQSDPVLSEIFAEKG